MKQNNENRLEYHAISVCSRPLSFMVSFLSKALVFSILPSSYLRQLYDSSISKLNRPCMAYLVLQITHCQLNETYGRTAPLLAWNHQTCTFVIRFDRYVRNLNSDWYVAICLFMPVYGLTTTTVSASLFSSEFFLKKKREGICGSSIPSL